jgi:Ala-tRNA(Pro) deacylase
MDAETRLYDGLKAAGIEYDVVEHQPVFTVAESSALHDQLPGTHSKNLFLKDNDSVFWLVTVPAEIRVDLKSLPAVIGSKRLSFGKADDMERLLGLTPGSVTPLGAINAAPGSITVVLDEGIADAAKVWVHPLRNSASLGLSGSDLLAQLRAWGHTPMVAAIPRVSA